MSWLASVIVSAGVPRKTNATISTRSSRPRSAWRRLSATRPKRPTVKSEKAMVVTESEREQRRPAEREQRLAGEAASWRAPPRSASSTALS